MKTQYQSNRGVQAYTTEQPSIKERWDSISPDNKENLGFGAFGLGAVILGVFCYNAVRKSQRKIESRLSSQEANSNDSQSKKDLGSDLLYDLEDVAPRFSLRRLFISSKYDFHESQKRDKEMYEAERARVNLRLLKTE